MVQLMLLLHRYSPLPFDYSCFLQVALDEGIFEVATEKGILKGIIGGKENFVYMLRYFKGSFSLFAEMKFS